LTLKVKADPVLLIPCTTVNEGSVKSPVVKVMTFVVVAWPPPFSTGLKVRM
jgi:hypothetical protein